MARIFVSHKNYDKPIVLPLVKKIEDSLGEKCWVDLMNIESDSQFADVICKAINECEVFLFMHSQRVSAITDFARDWTSREISYAEKRDKRIVIVNVDGSEMNDYYQLLYGTKQMVDAQNNDCFDKLLKDLRMWLSPQQAESDNSSVSRYKNDDKSRVYFADKDTPIVVLIGPPAVGKTMTMARLIRYLQENDYTITLDRSFYDDNGIHYDRILDDFQAIVNNGEQAPGTSLGEGFLINVYKKGNKIIQVLDIAGEEFFMGSFGRNEYSKTIIEVVKIQNVKIPIFFFEPNMGSLDLRESYVQSINRFVWQICRRDERCILLYNKIDTIEADRSLYQSRKFLFDNFREQFPHIMDCFRNQNRLTKVIKPYTASFVPFRTGTYNYKPGYKTLYTPSNSKYPKHLWKTICSIISKTKYNK